MKKMESTPWSWERIYKIVEVAGWGIAYREKNRKIFVRGRHRIEVKRVPSINRWKVEYYNGSSMDDTSGLETEKEAKVDAVEMIVLKSSY